MVRTPPNLSAVLERWECLTPLIHYVSLHMGLKDLLLVIGQAKGLSERVNDRAGTIVTQVGIASCSIHANDVGKIFNGPGFQKARPMCRAHVGPIGDDNE